MYTSNPVNPAPAPIVTSTVGVELAWVSAPLTRTTPPEEPLAEAVMMPSPEGAPAKALAPPTPERVWVPAPAAVRSITSSWRPVPMPVKSTPSVPIRLVPVSVTLVTGSVGSKETRPDPSADWANWNVSAVRLAT